LTYLLTHLHLLYGRDGGESRNPFLRERWLDHYPDDKIDTRNNCMCYVSFALLE